MQEGASMEGYAKEIGVVRKPQVDVAVEGKTYPVYEQGNGVYSVVAEDGRSFMSDPNESGKDLVERALKMGVVLKETK